MPSGAAEHSTATRERILDAAAAEFSAYGLSGARLDRIFAATGMTKGAFYFHFKSKRDVAEAILAQRFDRRDSIVDDVRSDGARGLLGLKVLSRRVTKTMALDIRTRAAMALSQELHLVSQGPDPYRAWAQRFAPFLREAIAFGEAASGLSVETASKTIVSCLFGILEVAVDAGTESAIDEELDSLWSLLEPGLLHYGH